MSSLTRAGVIETLRSGRALIAVSCMSFAACSSGVPEKLGCGRVSSFRRGVSVHCAAQGQLNKYESAICGGAPSLVCWLVT